MANVYKPKSGETVRNITLTKEERQRHNQEARADREYKDKIKKERFAAIRARRKQGPVGSGGIRITVEQERK